MNDPSGSGWEGTTRGAVSERDVALGRGSRKTHEGPAPGLFESVEHRHLVFVRVAFYVEAGAVAVLQLAELREIELASLAVLIAVEGVFLARRSTLGSARAHTILEIAGIRRTARRTQVVGVLAALAVLLGASNAIVGVSGSSEGGADSMIGAAELVLGAAILAKTRRLSEVGSRLDAFVFARGEEGSDGLSRLVLRLSGVLLLVLGSVRLWTAIG